jgi:tRNA-specific 2-thiouridylase
VTVGGEDKLLSRTLVARDLNWISIADLTSPMRVEVKIRHRHEPAPATIEKTGPDEVRATFDEPARAVTPGQSAVFYQGDVVVGGGWIAAQ